MRNLLDSPWQTLSIPSAFFRSNCGNVRKTDQFVQKTWMAFLNFQKIKSMTQAWKEGKEDVARKVLDHYDDAQSIVVWSDHTVCASLSPPPPTPPQQDPHVHLSTYAFLNPPLPLGIQVLLPTNPTRSTPLATLRTYCFLLTWWFLLI